jgi:hypothetical protein
MSPRRTAPGLMCPGIPSEATGVNLGMSKRVPRRALVFLSVTAALVGCGQRRAEPAPAIDEATAARLGITPDAVDPTERDKDKGYLLWKEKPETTGTEDPTSPGRRKVGGMPG